VPAVHPVTVCHLLQMTSGIPTFHSDTSPEVRALAGEMEEAQAQGRPLTTMQAAERIGRLPLRFQPGEGFLYGMSMDVAGAVIEAVTGRTLAEYLDETVFTPFEMRDTAFYVKAPERLADIVRGDGGGFRRAPEPRYHQVPEPPAFACGGDGVYSTLHDILRFADRLSCAEGTADAATVRQMTSPPLKDLSAASFHEIPILRGKRYAMGCSVVTRPDDCAIAARAGEFGWYGHAGGWMMCLPSHKLSAVLLAQRLPSAHTELVPPFSEYIGRLLLE
jgi:CubicO group peptidase (beta-lactamase class C family)